MAKIEIRPIERKAWHGKVGSDSFSRDKVIRALVNPRTMKYDCELDNEKKIFKNPKTGEENSMTELEYYSELIGIKLDPQYTGEEHPFYDSKLGGIKLKNSTFFLDTNIPIDYIRYKICRNSKFVANSKTDLEDGLYPQATHVIFDEQEEISVKLKKSEAKKQATIKLSKINMPQKIQILQIMLNKDCKNQSNDYIEVQISDLIDNKAEDILALLEKDKEDLALEALVHEAIQKSYIRKINGQYKYFDSSFGFEIHDVIDSLRKVENQEIKIRLMAQINSR